MGFVNRLIPEYLKLHLDEANWGDSTGAAVEPRERPTTAGGAWQLYELTPDRRGKGADSPEVAREDRRPGVSGAGRRVAGVPLRRRVEQLLRTAGEVTACDAAAAYLLDETTSELNLCATWGRAGRRTNHATRPLRGQLADLEALLGQAVVIQRVGESPEWRVPEDCGAAACVPISAGAPLGTLWTFSQKPRNFTPEQVQMLDVLAGRIAIEVERDTLLEESAVLKAWHRHWRRAVEWQQGQRPQPTQLADGWNLAVATSKAAPLVGGYHDWTLLPSEQLAVAVGQAQGDVVESQLTLAALHAGLKSHAPYSRSPSRLLRRLNDTFWTGSAGDQFAALGYAMIDSRSGSIDFAATGPVAAVVVRPETHVVLHGGLMFLGEDPDEAFDPIQVGLATGESLVLVHPVPGAYAARERALREVEPIDSVLMSTLADGTWSGELARRVRDLQAVPTSQISSRLESAWREIARGETAEPTLVIVRRERP